MQDFTPYQSPKADLTPPPPGGDFQVGPPQRVTVGQAIGWIGRGKALLSGHWGLLIGALLTIFVINIALGFIPLLGDIVLIFLMPLLYAGLVQITHGLDRGQGAEFSDLFRGFSRRTSPLLLLALAQIGVFLVVGLVFVLLAMAMVGGMDTLLAAEGVPPAMWVLGLLILLAVIVVSFMFYFAVPLIYLGEKGVGDAIAMSFYGCLANLVPILVYGILAILLSILGMLLLGVGLLLVVPILACAYYLSFKDIFVTENSYEL